MMPLAFDFISTLVIGSTLPVATTDFTIVPTSTSASRDGSIAGEAPFSVAKPASPATAKRTAAWPRNTPLRDFPLLAVIGSVTKTGRAKFRT